jgi:hypothetical protein
MSTINKEEYARLNRALYELEDLLGCMGVRELSLSKENRCVRMDTAVENLDTELLNWFCKNIDQIHASKFGEVAA